MNKEILSCKGVSVRYDTGHSQVISDVSFSLKPAEKIALLGLNGSGKTTLLSAIVGLVDFDGEIVICSEPLNRRSLVSLRQKVGFLFNVPEDQLLFPTVKEDVAFGLLKTDMPKEQSADHVMTILERLGIPHLADEPVHHLSHGQKQRVALAGAMVTNPPLLLLDEPTAGLDPPGKSALANILQGLESSQLIATHDLDFVDRICTRIILLDQGTIASEAESTDKVRKHWGL
jgi:cobalt/nickel transport system ATP-binding protein